jgi:uncharacterized protein (DUF924 family)
MELVELRDWWIQNPQIWFGSNGEDDLIITTKYEKIFDIFDSKYIKTKFNLLTLHTGNIILEEGVGLIILYDQIPRHIQRTKKLPETFIKDKLNKIVEFAEQFYLENKILLTDEDFCFSLLPLRHTNI